MASGEAVESVVHQGKNGRIECAHRHRIDERPVGGLYLEYQQERINRQPVRRRPRDGEDGRNWASVFAWVVNGMVRTSGLRRANPSF
jgi:hypothetical protein